jgi:hypothetical protein
MPVSILIVVDFPAPLCPSRQKTYFLKSAKPIPLTTFFFPNDFSKFLTINVIYFF